MKITHVVPLRVRRPIGITIIDAIAKPGHVNQNLMVFGNER